MPYFVTKDKAKLWYEVHGEGDPIFCCNGLGVSASYWAPLIKHFQKKYKVIVWDYRGHGRSDLGHSKKVSIDTLACDAGALIKNLKLKNTTLIGHSYGFQVALEVYSSNIRNIKRLVSFLGTYGKILDYFMDSKWSRPAFDLSYLLTAAFPKESRTVSRVLFKSHFAYAVAALGSLINPKLFKPDDLNQYLDHILATDPAMLMTLAYSADEHSAEGLLPKIKCPTLIVCAERDKFIPPSVARYMHRKIKGSHLVEIKEGTHAALFEQSRLFNKALENFLRKK